MEKKKTEERIQNAKQYSKLLDDFEFIETESNNKDNTKKVMS